MSWANIEFATLATGSARLDSHRYLPNKPSGNTHNESARPQTSKRLVRSYQGYVKNHISPCTPFGGMRVPFRVVKRKNPHIKPVPFPEKSSD